jgi:hypothetical protein
MGSFFSPSRYGSFTTSESVEPFDLPQIIRTFQSNGGLQNVGMSARVFYQLGFGETLTCIWPEHPAETLSLCWDSAPVLSITCPPAQNSRFTDFLRLARPTAPFQKGAPAAPFSLSPSDSCVHLVPCNSLITRLALQIEKPDFCSIWQGFLRAMRQCADNKSPIPAITDTSIELSSSLLHQKIVCIAIQFGKAKRKRRTPRYAFTVDQVEGIVNCVLNDIGWSDDLFDVVHTVMRCRDHPQGRLERQLRDCSRAVIASIKRCCFDGLYDPGHQSKLALDWLFGRKMEDVMPALVFVRCCWECEKMVVPEGCPDLTEEKAKLEQWLKDVDACVVPIQEVEVAVRKVAELDKKVHRIEELVQRFGQREFVSTLAQHGSRRARGHGTENENGRGATSDGAGCISRGRGGELAEAVRRGHGREGHVRKGSHREVLKEGEGGCRLGK